MKHGNMKDHGCCGDEGRLGNSGQSRKASGTGQSRVDAMRDTGAMSSKVQSAMHSHPMKDGSVRKP